jgi:hypothetical protein
LKGGASSLTTKFLPHRHIAWQLVTYFTSPSKFSTCHRFKDFNAYVIFIILCPQLKIFRECISGEMPILLVFSFVSSWEEAGNIQLKRQPNRARSCLIKNRRNMQPGTSTEGTEGNKVNTIITSMGHMTS